MAARIDPQVVVRAPSPFRSSRASWPPRLIVIHATESHNRPGNADLAAIGSWFQNPSAQVSAHVCTDADGHSARYVRDRDKAWHCGGYNSLSLGIEQIGNHAQGKWDGKELHETARWVARWSMLYHIPIKRGSVRNGSVLQSGVVTHQQLGSLGGNHDDPGPHYPMAEMLAMALRYKARLKERAAKA